MFLNQFQINCLEKKQKTLENIVKIMPPFLKILAMPQSTVYQHFPNKRSKFHSKVVKDSQDCDAKL